MFAPEGYVSFADISVNVEQLAHSAIIRLTGSSAGGREKRATIADEMVRAGIIRHRNNSEFVREFIEEYFLAKLLEVYPPAACSPSGTIMQVSEQFFIHADRLDWFYLHFPIDTMSELSSYLQYSKKNGFNGLSVRRRYCFIDAELGLIKIKNNSRALFDSCSHGPEDWGRRMVDVVRSFSGWSLCWKEESLPSGLELVKHIFPDSDNIFNWEGFFDDDNPGMQRTSSQRILSELLQAYPDGKSEKWEIVEKRVGYARRSIERALDATGRKDWKLVGGQE